MWLAVNVFHDRSSSILECKLAMATYVIVVVNIEVAPYWNVNKLEPTNIVDKGEYRSSSILECKFCVEYIEL